MLAPAAGAAVAMESLRESSVRAFQFPTRAEPEATFSPDSRKMQGIFKSGRAVDFVPDVFHVAAMRSETDSSVDPALRVAGRGAASNEAGRFERHATAFEDDGWEGEAQERPLRTTVETDQARKVVSYNSSPDLPFDRSLNPYRGCEHGCVYCYARPSHAWLGLSPGLDFETRLIAKPNAPEALGAGAFAALLQAPHHRDRGEHRRLPADRGRAAE